MVNSFEKQKQSCLSKTDKSFKKSWDKKIRGLCEKINKLDKYHTTSSCAGRIVIIKDKEKKQPGLFEYVTHDLINLKKLKNALKGVNFGEFVKFKQEPVLLHVACKDLKSAQFLVDKAKLAGWKRSGIIATSKRFIVELMSTEKLEFLIMNKNRLLVNNSYLEIVVKRSNENLKKTWKKIKRLSKDL